eukprot:3042371-Rhodomonas_salina.1
MYFVRSQRAKGFDFAWVVRRSAACPDQLLSRAMAVHFVRSQPAKGFDFASTAFARAVCPRCTGTERKAI